MDFRVLGPLEVLDGDRALALGGPRQRLALASLILDANRVVAIDTLIDRIWGDEPPDAARASLFAYVSRLRRLLGTDRIQPRAPGYVLRADRGEVDLLRFEDLTERARRTAGDAEGSAAFLTEALDLWRGGALSDLADFDALQPVITRLEELRLGAIEDRLEAELELGRHRQAVPQLESLTAEHPLRERLWSQLMLALYRSGRQGDALNAFQRARTHLVEELGIDPSPELRRLHEQILKQDPALGLERAGSEPAGPTPSAPIPDARPSLAAPAPAAGLRRRRPALVGAALLVILGTTVVAWPIVNGSRGFPNTTWAIGLDMPLSGGAAHLGEPVRNAVQLAIDDLKAAGGVGGVTLRLITLDDGQDGTRAADNARAFVDDPSVVAMIGPWGSGPTFPVIPITNQAGLLECSPSATHPGLTKPRAGALDLRSAHPDAINFVRLAPSDDIQALAMAAFASRDLDAKVVLVIDDTADGRLIADNFDTAFQRAGGTTVRRALNPGADPRLVLAPLADELNPPGLVFLGGDMATGAAVRQAMADAGRLSTPLLSWDALLYGSAGDSRSYIERLGPDAAAGSYAAHASLPDHKFSFADAYRQRFGSEPDEYAAAGYACVQIIAAAVRDVASRGPQSDEVRELLRATAVERGKRYETVLGTVGFDANGDALQQFVIFYRVEPSAGNGSGDWVIFKKQDFGPAP